LKRPPHDQREFWIFVCILVLMFVYVVADVLIRWNS